MENTNTSANRNTETKFHKISGGKTYVRIQVVSVVRTMVVVLTVHLRRHRHVSAHRKYEPETLRKKSEPPKLLLQP